MFDRFTEEARAAVVSAQTEARALGHGWIGTEHLLLGVVAGGGVPGLDAETVRADVVREIGRGDGALDPAALATLGIDLDVVRERVEASFGPGALSTSAGACGPGMPFTKHAKKALELALREAAALRSGEIRADHLVLGLLREGDGVGARILTMRGVSLEAFRRRVQGSDAA